MAHGCHLQAHVGMAGSIGLDVRTRFLGPLKAGWTSNRCARKLDIPQKYRWYTAMIPRQTTRDSKRAYNKLVELLLSGAISEDVALSERGLSMALGLGRTPIREAVKDLVREGVLESHPTR